MKNNNNKYEKISSTCTLCTQNIKKNENMGYILHETKRKKKERKKNNNALSPLKKKKKKKR